VSPHKRKMFQLVVFGVVLTTSDKHVKTDQQSNEEHMSNLNIDEFHFELFHRFIILPPYNPSTVINIFTGLFRSGIVYRHSNGRHA
jgi:hypothetical protein